jgi:hypothetical protein
MSTTNLIPAKRAAEARLYFHPKNDDGSAFSELAAFKSDGRSGYFAECRISLIGQLLEQVNDVGVTFWKLEIQKVRRRGKVAELSGDFRSHEALIGVACIEQRAVLKEAFGKIWRRRGADIPTPDTIIHCPPVPHQNILLLFWRGDKAGVQRAAIVVQCRLLCKNHVGVILNISPRYLYRYFFALVRPENFAGLRVTPQPRLVRKHRRLLFAVRPIARSQVIARPNRGNLNERV